MAFRPSAHVLMPDLTPQQELVLLARSLWREGYDDHLAGHITINRGDGTLWCNPWLLTWEEIRPSDVIAIDLEGNVVEGDWHARAIANSPLETPLPQRYLDSMKAGDGSGFHGFWEAAVRRELRADPTLGG